MPVGESGYLVAIRGEPQCARSLRAVGEARLWEHGRTIQIRAVEAHGDEKRTVIEAFVASSRYAPTRRKPHPDDPRAALHERRPADHEQDEPDRCGGRR